MIRIGIDVGREKTDGVVMDQRFHILTSASQRTTPDVMTGIQLIITQLLKQANVSPYNIKAVMVGTNLFLDALQEEKTLAQVCTVRVSQAKGSITPLYEGSELFRKAIGLVYCELQGGHEVDGRESESLPSRPALDTFLQSISSHCFDAFAITSTFSPVNDSHERMVMGWIQETLGKEHSFTLSHELGSIGFLQRENTAILNAALSRIMKEALQGLDQLLHKLGIDAGIYLVQNDGSLMSYDYALRYPIRALYSGMTTSLRGASFLTQLNDCIVIDMTTEATRIGVLEDGFPKDRWKNATIAGIHVNIPMPELVTLPFGGKHSISDDQLDAVFDVMQRFQPQYDPLPIVIVGEGSEELAKKFRFPWADVVQPPNYMHVSAIGACIAPISGNVDRMYWLKGMEREDAVEMATQEAVQEAIRSGATLESVTAKSIKATPLAYIPSQALRVQVKAIASLV
ncbi:hydantoinase/oxoprolinase N-terminal domain-containing protein [Aneurinibacillus sp. Ricciae_BoGa-3]|uniref:hydantoinase/oxoprolinase N-terminal domain-containing protein n=1 Tax=Aneurinibacillus sp. Ricciae_BoGa-3 TaxID=3022697 RepID=UPI0023405B1F|nr:hydantoinase/oxoprolinase N-terminal domain-containing protein [Aneurinibacillus sp. Ricciae_BoGa-3]WCK52618.1 hydantoinase/oxoprolinase N-terminal domain-containing protein [Aneurinibacillus sp. Ricciae_BoGa-3]